MNTVFMKRARTDVMIVAIQLALETEGSARAGRACVLARLLSRNAY